MCILNVHISVVKSLMRELRTKKCLLTIELKPKSFIYMIK